MWLQMLVLHSSVEILGVLRKVLENWMRTDRPSSYENRQDNNCGTLQYVVVNASHVPDFYLHNMFM